MLTYSPRIAAATPAKIVIDCSDLSGGGGVHPELEQLVEWVRGSPERSSVHVTLRSHLSGEVPRKYHMLLQSLGCTVTAKARFR